MLFWVLGSLLVAGLLMVARFALRGPPPPEPAFKSGREFYLFSAMCQTFAEHEETLGRKLLHCRIKDDYGRWVRDRWDRELDYFFTHLVLPSLPRSVTRAEVAELRTTFELMCDDFDFDEIAAELGDQPAPPSDGIAYERHTAARLVQAGYSVSFTPPTGDQGVDIIAVRGKSRVAIQCKNYLTPVGNDAVQQVYAGMKFHNCELALVAAPNGFTRSATDLAQTLGVICVHQDDLVPVLAKQTPTPGISAS